MFSHCQVELPQIPGCGIRGSHSAEAPGRVPTDQIRCHSSGCEPVSIRIAPSILSADFAALGEEIRKVEQAGAQLIHVDVMDGHFVPNITIGPPVVESIRKVTKLPLDVHLMISDPDKYIPAFVDAGANMLTVHAEATIHLDRTLNFIRSQRAGAGVSINPATPVRNVEHAVALADMLLIMTVNPGFGGQRFIPYTVEKIRQARQLI